MNCPICGEELIWNSDYTCEDTMECGCEQGTTGIYTCEPCNAMVEITTTCDKVKHLINGVEDEIQ